MNADDAFVILAAIALILIVTSLVVGFLAIFTQVNTSNLISSIVSANGLRGNITKSKMELSTSVTGILSGLDGAIVVTTLPTGPQGDKGDQGDKGNTGDQGPIGPMSIKPRLFGTAYQENAGGYIVLYTVNVAYPFNLGVTFASTPVNFEQVEGAIGEYKYIGITPQTITVEFIFCTQDHGVTLSNYDFTLSKNNAPSDVINGITRVQISQTTIQTMTFNGQVDVETGDNIRIMAKNVTANGGLLEGISWSLNFQGV